MTEEPAREQLQRSEDREHDEVPRVLRRVVDGERTGGRIGRGIRRTREREQVEQPREREPHPDTPGQIDGVEQLVAGRGRLERSARPVDRRPHTESGERQRDHELEPSHPVAASAARTSSSVTWSNRSYHSPTAENPYGVWSSTTASQTPPSRAAVSGGPTGAPKTTAGARCARAHPTAARAVPPVATPSSTITAVRPSRSTAGRAPRDAAGRG